METSVAFDPNYKMKFRPTKVSRLRKMECPLHMVGDPNYPVPYVRAPGMTWQQSVWDRHCRTVYEYAMALKRGVVPNEERNGVWYWREQ